MANGRTSIEDALAAVAAIESSLEPLTERMLQSAHLKPCREMLDGLDELTERVALAHATLRTMYDRLDWLLEQLDCTPAQLWALADRLREER